MKKLIYKPKDGGIHTNGYRPGVVVEFETETAQGLLATGGWELVVDTPKPAVRGGE